MNRINTELVCCSACKHLIKKVENNEKKEVIMKTKTEQAIAYLLKKGFSEMPNKSRKYRKFGHPQWGNMYLFVGRAGAVRQGKNISNSLSVTAYVDRQIKKEMTRDKK